MKFKEKGTNNIEHVQTIFSHYCPLQGTNVPASYPSSEQQIKKQKQKGNTLKQRKKGKKNNHAE